jgi:hypothetical protein
MSNDDYENSENLNDSEEFVHREDKIFNNSYNTGEGLKDTDEYEFSKKISVSSDYSDSYLKDVYEYEENLETKFILDGIFEFIKKDESLNKIVFHTQTDSQIFKNKFAKDEINIIFNRIHNSLDEVSQNTSFYSPIYVLEAISSFSGFDYKKIFDSLDTDAQELLLVELDKKYNFLDGKMHKKRIH